MRAVGLDEPLFVRRGEGAYLYDREGKRYLTIAVGCTGGQHRSVFITHYLAQKLHGSGHPIQEFHRDLSRHKS